MSEQLDVSLPSAHLTWGEVFPTGAPDPSATYMEIPPWAQPISFFVGRNGSGKSRAARALTQKLPDSRLLDADRLVSLMSFNVFTWGANPVDFKGIPLGEQERSQMKQITRKRPLATEDIYALREQPDVALRVAAFLKRALGRTVELRESSGFLDPHVSIGGIEYSLFRDEGHGLRELVILLAAAYRDDWSTLLIDEPELHLHPAMARLWLGELRKECIERDRRAIIITHEPSLIKILDADELDSVWYFQAGAKPLPFADAVHERAKDRVTASLRQNPELISQLVFSPRPVLVEGVHDVAALSAALERTKPSEVVSQTDLVCCGGSTEVALWFEIAHKMEIDVRAIADLDACLESSVQRVMDGKSTVIHKYREELALEPPRTSNVLKPLIDKMRLDGISGNPKERANWLADSVPAATGYRVRKDKLLRIWRENGLWLHPQGTIEKVLGIDAKGLSAARTAASVPGEIDRVADWCSYEVDPLGEVELLLNVAVERIAHSIMEALRAEPAAQFCTPIGSSAEADSRLVRVEPIREGVHRLTVVTPKEFKGYWLEFSRETRPSELILQPPERVDLPGAES
ncbi:ATP-dependent nuclease [Streptomyces coelicoflavus]|nr:AAA family ATPase [Streptomyces coelicoflavus]